MRFALPAFPLRGHGASGSPQRGTLAGGELGSPEGSSMPVPQPVPGHAGTRKALLATPLSPCLPPGCASDLTGFAAEPVLAEAHYCAVHSYSKKTRSCKDMGTERSTLFIFVFLWLCACQRAIILLPG